MKFSDEVVLLLC